MADSIVYPGLVHLNGCLMAAVDLETTGTRPGYHEIIQIAVVPLDSDFRPLADVRPFYTLVKPEHPEREIEAAKHKHKIPMTELLLHAPESSAGGGLAVRLVRGPEAAVQEVPDPAGAQLGLRVELLEGVAGRGANGPDLPQPRPRRDALRDLAQRQGRLRGRAGPVPTGRPRGHVQAKLGIINTNPHDALADCLAEAEVYHALLRMF